MPTAASTLDSVFGALSDPTRRAMIQQLSRGPVAVSDLARPLSLALPAAMQHLRVLETAGLIRSEKIGRVRTCRLEPAALLQAERWIVDRRAMWEGRLDRLGTFLANDDRTKRRSR
jgi:DNA-binding transcriptional ArsR family regulator